MDNRLQLDWSDPIDCMRVRIFGKVSTFSFPWKFSFFHGKDVDRWTREQNLKNLGASTRPRGLSCFLFYFDVTQYLNIYRFIVSHFQSLQESYFFWSQTYKTAERKFNDEALKIDFNDGMKLSWLSEILF